MNKRSFVWWVKVATRKKALNVMILRRRGVLFDITLRRGPLMFVKSELKCPWWMDAFSRNKRKHDRWILNIKQPVR